MQKCKRPLENYQPALIFFFPLWQQAQDWECRYSVNICRRTTESSWKFNKKKKIVERKLKSACFRKFPFKIFEWKPGSFHIQKKHENQPETLSLPYQRHLEALSYPLYSVSPQLCSATLWERGPR